MAAMTIIEESLMLLMPEVGKEDYRECSDVSLNFERNKDAREHEASVLDTLAPCPFACSSLLRQESPVSCYSFLL